MAENIAKSNVKILYVEDDALNQKILIMLLATLGYNNVSVVSNAKDALDILALPTTQFDLILMDLGLPDIDGIQLTEKIRHSNFITKDVPIIALTGNEVRRAQEKSFAAGMNGFLTKPIERETLKITLEKIFAAH